MNNKNKFDGELPPDYSFTLVHNFTRRLNQFNDDATPLVKEKTNEKLASLPCRRKDAPLEQQYGQMVAAFIRLENTLK